MTTVGTPSFWIWPASVASMVSTMSGLSASSSSVLTGAMMSDSTFGSPTSRGSRIFQPKCAAENTLGTPFTMSFPSPMATTNPSMSGGAPTMTIR